MRFVLALLLGLIAAATASGQTAPAPGAAGFTPAQRAEIVEILRQALKSDPSILRDAVTALQAQEAKDKATAAQTAIQELGAELTAAAGDPVAGDPHGDVTVVEFYDLRCPYCRRMAPVIADLLRQDPRVRLVYKDIPILGPPSVLASRAALAAQHQGAYTRLSAALMQGTSQITEDSLRATAGAVGLDWDRLQRDMADPAIEQRLHRNLEMAHRLGVDGTPVFVIGSRMVEGAVELAQLQDAVTAARGH
jgi:protein-disulfide isomerase